MRSCAECRAEIADQARFCPFCGASAPGAGAAPADPHVGQVVNGKYLVEALIGRGGMGRVYKARHLTLDRPVVLKMLHRGFSADPAVAERFHREAKAASRLDHPNSIAVLDFGQAEDGTLFMAMEYLAGKDLARVIGEEFPLGDARIIRIGAQILSALAEAHARGVVHRDLKPENVMVEPRREEPDFVKVLDFGIAKISGRNEQRITQAGLVCGTPEYMSPEQAQGKELDARSDLYSVGVILYQMMAGQLPFESDTPVGFLTKHLAEPPVPPSRRRPDLAVSPALEALVLRALEKSPDARQPSADAMRQELLACASGTTAERGPSATAFDVDAVPPAPTARPRLPLALGAAAVLLAGGAGALVALRASKPSPPVPAAAPIPAPPADTAPAAPALPVTSAASTPVPPPAATPAPPAAAAPPAPERKAAKKPSRRPDRARAVGLYERAEVRRAAQDPRGAIKLYLAAEAADPTLHQVHKKLALCYQQQGDKRRAAERYRKYLATNPDDADKVKAILAGLR
jgi:eukaryotic-like serine/threonine-protein kinase